MLERHLAVGGGSYGKWGLATGWNDTRVKRDKTTAVEWHWRADGEWRKLTMIELWRRTGEAVALF